VTAALVVAAAILGAWGATRSPLLDVDRVVIEGAGHTGDAPVRAAAAIGRGAAMTDVDSAGAVRRVSRLPWVGRVEVVREWPSTIRIRVVERGATAVTRTAVPAGGAASPGAAVAPWVLVDRLGRVLAPVASPPPGVAIVDGVPPAGAPGTQVPAATRRVLDVAAQLPPGLAPRVATVTLGAMGVELRLKPQGVVVVGGGDDIAAKLRATQTVLAAVDGRTVSTLDVRIPATPVLTQL